MNIYIDHENTKNADNLYVALSSDANGEGIVAAITKMGAMPLVVADYSLLEKIKPEIQRIATEGNKKIIIVKFNRAEVLEEINP